ncbi:hypothetical protein TRICI_001234 [Trichomonascus ciferrii]|uniref:CTLH domain-containing protein n=1 Tax=Trichomonascus ciferrii TaxID=44093 RepID=A0A642V9U7_9ASCO|nr:hypothetical protein TRICI_001234 [Trichomonascus ciferrii]
MMTVPPHSQTQQDEEQQQQQMTTTYHGFDRGEVTRLVIQAMYDLGYEAVAAQLEDQSGCMIETVAVRVFREAILNGRWTAAEEALDGLDGLGHVMRSMKFQIRRQEYLETLSNGLGDKREAMKVLRQRVRPLCDDAEDLHALANLMACGSTEDLREALPYWHDTDEARRELLNALQECMAPNVVLPPHRLATLLAQARKKQVEDARYWLESDGGEGFSLYKDYEADRSGFPTEAARVLDAHGDEVWYLEFSHDGRYLASSSADRTVIVWDVEQGFAIQSILEGHTGGVVYLCWSPDDSLMLTSSQDYTVMVWDPYTGEHKRTISEHTDVVGACAWLPDGDMFVTGSPDKKLCLWNTRGQKLYSWPPVRVMNMAITPDGSQLIVICNDNIIHFFDLATYAKICEMKVDKTLTSISVSKDSRYALINVKPEEVHLWDLETYRIVRKYVGQLQREFVIRSCFGGPHENYILSGSQDNHIYIWKRDSSELIETLPGHQGTVNCVKWSPTEVAMFASAGDDKTVRIWRPPSSSSNNT